MLKVICDRCGCECGRNASLITVEVIHNPAPLSPTDPNSLKITDDTTQMKLMYCQKCYAKLDFPNIYAVNYKK